MIRTKYIQIDQFILKLILAVILISHSHTADAIVLDKANSPYIFMEDFSVPSTDTLFITEGVIVLLGEGVDIRLFCNSYIKGTAEEPVIFRSVDPEGGWGRINIWTNTPKDFIIEHARIENGLFHSINTNVTMKYVEFHNDLDLLWNEAIARIIRGSATIQNCKVYGTKKGEGFLIHESENAVIEDCYFQSIPDAIEFISMKNSLIRSNVFFNIEDDAIDLNHSEDILIDSNYISKIQDRGFEIGAETFGKSNNIQIVRNIITGCDEGVNFKEGSTGRIENCTFYNNRIGISCFEDVEGAGGSEVVVINTILSASLEEDIDKDNISSVSTSFSLSDSKLLSGEFNLYEDPLFVNPYEGDFNLQKGSPCVDSGNPDDQSDPDHTRIDMGALYRDINTNIDELSVFNSIKIYPNPFLDHCNVEISLEHNALVTVMLYNQNGTEIGTVFDGELPKGKKKLSFNVCYFNEWNSSNIFLRIWINGNSKSYKLIHNIQ